MSINNTPFRHRGAIEKHRDKVTRIDSMTVKPTKVSGYVLISHELDAAAAEAAVDIVFPVVFAEKPVFTYGSELDVNNSALAGSYPEFSATVVGWTNIGAIEGVSEGRFTGCTVITVSRGQVGQNIWLHYSFEGKAIRNPINEIAIEDVL